MYSNMHLDILKFSFHHSSTKFPFNSLRVSNQNLSCEGQFELIAFASTSLGVTKVRAATISIPGFADQEQERATASLLNASILCVDLDDRFTFIH